MEGDMDKMDITIMHIRECKDINEAWDKMCDPITGFGYKLTRNEISLCKHYAVLFFEGK